jgi:hypothetical protein
MSPYTAVRDRVTRVTPLGIRFWDPVAARIVADGLTVCVYAKDAPERRELAMANRIGTFVLPHLPGMRDRAIETGEGDAAFWQTVRRRAFVIEVRDAHGWFQPFTIEQPLPARGLATPPGLPFASPPIDAVPMFSAPSRPVPDGMAVLRADLSAHLSGRAEPIPASWAVLEVRAAGQPPAYGVADRNGRIAVVFPYPEPLTTPARAGSPPFAPGQSLWDLEWPIEVAAFYDAVSPAPGVPDLSRTLAQRPAMLWSDPSATRPLPRQALRFGQELIVRNTFITTAGSPP